MNDKKDSVNNGNTKNTTQNPNTYIPKRMDRIDRIFIPLIKSL